MSDKVVQLGESKPSADVVIQAADEVMRRIRAGGITGLFVVLEYDRKEYGTFAMSAECNHHVLLAGVELVKHDLVKNINNNPRT